MLDNIVAIYLIVIGLLGLFGTGGMHLRQLACATGRARRVLLLDQSGKVVAR